MKTQCREVSVRNWSLFSERKSMNAKNKVWFAARVAILAAGFVVAVGSPAFADIVTSSGNSGYAVPTPDLLRASGTQVSYDGNIYTGEGGSGNIGVLTDGNSAPVGYGGGTFAIGGYAWTPTSPTLIYTLDTTSNKQGYDISQIATYTGPISLRDWQDYTVSYSTVSARTHTRTLRR